MAHQPPRPTPGLPRVSGLDGELLTDALRTPHTAAMVRMELLVSVATLALWIFCLVDVIGARDSEIRNLPKVAWVLIVLFFPLAGSVAWLVAGRPQRVVAAGSRYERAVPEFPEYDRPGRAAGTTAEADEEFLRKVRERAEEQRRAYREQRRRQQEGSGTD